MTLSVPSFFAKERDFPMIVTESVPPSPVLRALNEPFIKFYPCFAQAFGGMDEAILLQHLIDWTRFSKNGWVFRTQPEIEEVTGIPAKRQWRALQSLVAAKAIKIDRRGIPARNYYHVNDETITKLLSSSDELPDLGESNSPIPVKENNQENNVKKKSSTSSPATGGSPGPDLRGFSDWYAGYPRKQKRKEAEAAWMRLSVIQKAAAMAGLKTFVFPEPQYIPLPASWLNQERWTDEPPPTRKVPVDQLPPPLKKRYDSVVQERTSERREILPLPPDLQRDIDDWKRSQSV